MTRSDDVNVREEHTKSGTKTKKGEKVVVRKGQKKKRRQASAGHWGGLRVSDKEIEQHAMRLKSQQETVDGVVNVRPSTGRECGDNPTGGCSSG